MSFWKSLLRSERPQGVVKAVPFVPREERPEREAEARYEPPDTVGLPPAEQQAHQPEGKLCLIDLDLIDSNPYQPRRRFDEDALVELAASIVEFGVLQPVTLRQVGDRYQLIAGERRSKAARLAGLNSIPAIVREMDDNQVAMLSLIENLQREELNVVEEATSYARLLSEFSLTQEELARQLGRSQSSIANKLRLLRLPAAIQEALIVGQLTERHARALLRLATQEQQLEAMGLIITQGMNVRQSEEWVEEQLRQQAPSDPSPTRVRRFVPKNLLLFFNEFKRIVKTMQQAGIDSAYEQEEEGEYWVITVRMKKSMS